MMKQDSNDRQRTKTIDIRAIRIRLIREQGGHLEFSEEGN